METTTRAQHTPEPWETHDERRDGSHDGMIYETEQGHTIAILAPNYDTPANARLIASAPALLRELIEARRIIAMRDKEYGELAEDIRRFDAAIRQARGFASPDETDA